MPALPKNRGATRNDRSTRFNDRMHVADGDWLDAIADVDGKVPPVQTPVTLEHSKSIITWQTSPDLPFDRSLNAYRRCEHGCIYCFARPTHAVHNLSPGLDFESRLFAKPAAAKVLRTELMEPGYTPAPLALGSNTDPYQPIEDRFRITRAVLEVLAGFRHPVTITTKSARVARDCDLLAHMAAQHLAAVVISPTSLDPATARTFGPRAASPASRLRAIRALSAVGVPVFASISPIIPAITDHAIEAIIAAADAGAVGAFAMLVRPPHEVAPLFRDWREAHYPARHKGDGAHP